MGAPWMEKDVERWAGASFYKYHKKLARHITRWFEIHPNPERLRMGWLAWAIENQPACELQEPHPELENSSAYPIEKITNRFGRYFTSTVSYMIASAIDAGASEISLFGVDMKGKKEYIRQRACCEYLIGLARGMGIDVYVHDRSPMLQFKHLYGYEYLDIGDSFEFRVISHADPLPFHIPGSSSSADSCWVNAFG